MTATPLSGPDQKEGFVVGLRQGAGGTRLRDPLILLYESNVVKVLSRTARSDLYEVEK